MIPYDNLVAALSAWRARQGLPVTTGSGGSGPTPRPGSGPHRSPGSGPYGAASARPATEDAELVDEVLSEEPYEGGGYGAYEADPEPTSIAAAPERPTEDDMDRGRDDW